MKTTLQHRAFAITVASLIAVSGTTARAQDTWDGGGADNNFTTGANWADTTAPNNAAAGALTFAGVARLTPNADLTYSGITSITFAAGAGAFVIGGSDLSFTGGAVITNSSTNFQRFNNNLIITDTGLTLDASTAELIINGATLTNGGFTTTVQGSNNVTINSVISGTGGLTMNGTGTLALIGANTYTGTTTLINGTTIVDGTIAGAVNNSATLTGAGTINGNYTGLAGSNLNANTAGITGTMNFGASFTLNANATLTVDISKTGGGVITNDQVVVGTTATFAANSTISLNDLVGGGTWTVGDTLVIANSTTSSVNSGLIVIDTFAFLNFIVVINGTNLELVAVAAGTLATAATNANNVALGTALDTDSPTAAGNFLTFINALTAQGAGAPINNAMQASSPLAFASVADANVRMLQQQARVNADYLRARRNGTAAAFAPATAQSDMQFASAAANPALLATAIRQAQTGEQDTPSNGSSASGDDQWKVYGNIFALYSDQDNRVGYAGYTADAYGGQIGVDTSINSELIVGLMVGLSTTEIDFATGGNADVDSFRIGPYLSWEAQENLIVDASVTYGQHSSDVSRIVSFPGFTGTATSDFEARDISLYAAVGYDIEEEDFTYTPFASLNYTYYDSDSYTEAGGGGAALRVDSSQLESLQAQLGVRANTVYEGNGSMKLVPEAYLAVGSELMDEDSIEATFVGGATRFTTDPDHADTSFLFGAGTSVLISNGISAFIRYDGEVSGDGELHAISGGLNFQF